MEAIEESRVSSLRGWEYRQDPSPGQGIHLKRDRDKDRQSWEYQWVWEINVPIYSPYFLCEIITENKNEVDEQSGYRESKGEREQAGKVGACDRILDIKKNCPLTSFSIVLFIPHS